MFAIALSDGKTVTSEFWMIESVDPNPVGSLTITILSRRVQI
jgi:hypothetical protein